MKYWTFMIKCVCILKIFTSLLWVRWLFSSTKFIFEEIHSLLVLDKNFSHQHFLLHKNSKTKFQGFLCHIWYHLYLFWLFLQNYSKLNPLKNSCSNCCWNLQNMFPNRSLLFCLELNRLCYNTFHIYMNFTFL